MSVTAESAPAPDREGPAAAANEAAREKQGAAFWSVVAAVALTAMKLSVGLATGSLGLLAEAAHSALDFVAALVTWFAVRFADRPPDPEHPFGHKRVENLSALFETLLLLVTCAWIAGEAIERLRHGGTEVEATAAAFAVILISIAIDINRSRNLQAMADKHRSQALEADALHFSTDVWSSCVVLFGLACVKAGETFGVPALELADPLAALGVCVIVVHVSLRLGRKSVDALLDRAPAGLRERVAAAARAVPGVLDCVRVRPREAGDGVFLDLTVEVARHTDLEDGHRIADLIEERILAFEPKADVVVHLEPQRDEGETLIERVRVLAQRLGVAAHNIALYESETGRRLELHLELDESLDLSAAHAQSERLEACILGEFPELSGVTTHLEGRRLRGEAVAREADDAPTLAGKAGEIARTVPGVVACRDVVVFVAAGRVSVTMRCVFPGQMPIHEAHRLADLVERRIAEAVPQVDRVLVRAVPA